jgi:hypothetical protein
MILKKAVSNILRTADIKLCKLSVYQELAGELETSRRVLANTWHKKVEKLNLSDLKIYCISLSDSQARRQEILEMKNKFGLSLEFVDAIDVVEVAPRKRSKHLQSEKSDGTA